MYDSLQQYREKPYQYSIDHQMTDSTRASYVKRTLPYSTWSLSEHASATPVRTSCVFSSTEIKNKVNLPSQAADHCIGRNTSLNRFEKRLMNNQLSASSYSRGTVGGQPRHGSIHAHTGRRQHTGFVFFCFFFVSVGRCDMQGQS